MTCVTENELGALPQQEDGRMFVALRLSRYGWEHILGRGYYGKSREGALSSPCCVKLTHCHRGDSKLPGGAEKASDDLLITFQLQLQSTKLTTIGCTRVGIVCVASKEVACLDWCFSWRDSDLRIPLALIKH